MRLCLVVGYCATFYVGVQEWSLSPFVLRVTVLSFSLAEMLYSIADPQWTVFAVGV